jgi:Tfp pilus assembly protein PilP
VLADEELDVSKIDQILRGDEEVLRGDTFEYDPAGRRDPFRSLLEGFEEQSDEGAEVRPPGLPGMLVEELRVEGIIETPSGILAFVQGRDNLSYIIRPGTKLYNGEVKEIFRDRVVFRQQVNDPKQVRPYNEVVREVSD